MESDDDRRCALLTLCVVVLSSGSEDGANDDVDAAFAMTYFDEGVPSADSASQPRWAFCATSDILDGPTMKKKNCTPFVKGPDGSTSFVGTVNLPVDKM